MKILNTIENFDDEAKKILAQAGFEVDYKILSQDELKDKLGNYDGVIVGLERRFDKEVIESASNLKVIATATTGLDHIYVEYAQEHDIKVLSLQNEDLKEITGTAELAFGLLLALVRRIPEFFDDVKAGNWNRKKFLGNNLFGKVLGIFGLGRLGSMMALYGKAFGMRVIAHDPHKDVSDVAQLVDFKTLLSDADIISIHAPLNEDTAYTFEKDEFQNMKNSAYLINTSRGGFVQEDDLVDALTNKEISGYATDVLTIENFFENVDKVRPKFNSLIMYAKKHNNLIITPHIGGFTKESRAATDIIIAEKIVKALS